MATNEVFEKTPLLRQPLVPAPSEAAARQRSRVQARVTFVQTVADLATRPQNIDALQNAGVMALLRPPPPSRGSGAALSFAIPRGNGGSDNGVRSEKASPWNGSEVSER